MTSLPPHSLSLSLSLSLYLSLSPSAPHAQYRKRFRASYNTSMFSCGVWWWKQNVWMCCLKARKFVKTLPWKRFHHWQQLCASARTGNSGLRRGRELCPLFTFPKTYVLRPSVGSQTLFSWIILLWDFIGRAKILLFLQLFHIRPTTLGPSSPQPSNFSNRNLYLFGKLRWCRFRIHNLCRGLQTLLLTKKLKSRKVGLGTTVEYIERKFKTKA